MKFIKTFKIFESSNNDENNIINYDLLKDLYDLSLDYFDKNLKLKISATIGNSEDDEYIFSMIFDHNYNIDSMIIDTNNWDEILSIYNNEGSVCYDISIITPYNESDDFDDLFSFGDEEDEIHETETSELIDRIKNMYPSENIE